MAQVNLTMFRNNDWSADVAVTLNGAVLNITGGTLRMTAKWRTTDADGAAVFAVSSPSSGISITDPVNGKATITVAGSKTSTLPAYQVNLFYDLQLTDSNSKKYTLMNGLLTVKPDVSLTTP